MRDQPVKSLLHGQRGRFIDKVTYALIMGQQFGIENRMLEFLQYKCSLIFSSIIDHIHTFRREYTHCFNTDYSLLTGGMSRSDREVCF